MLANLSGMKRSRGTTFLTTLVFLSVIASLGLALAGLCVQHLSAAASQENRQQSLLLARSAVSLGLSRLMSNTNFGKPAQAGAQEVLQVTLPDNRPGASGRLTFDSQQAEQLGIAYSTNNLEKDQSTRGAGGRSVPQNSVLLIGEGRCGGVVRRVETVLAVPPFPYAVASAGPVDARLGVTIAGLPNSGNPDASGAAWLPADLLSNDSSAQAIFLGSGTSITGNVKAAGTVTLDPNAQQAIKIDGRVTSGAAREKIPHIPLANFDPLVGSAPYTTLTADPQGPASLSGVFRRQGNLHCAQGLSMDGGVLYVDGDLSVSGGITGKGLIACTGKLTVQGQSDFQSGNGLAVLAGKDLKVSGSGASGSFFQGLMYTEGSFEADKVTLVGTLVAADETTTRPVVLKNARIFHDPSPLTVVLPVPAPPVRGFRWRGARSDGSLTQAGGWTPDSEKASVVILDPSSFLNLVDQTRVVMWKEL